MWSQNPDGCVVTPQPWAGGLRAGGEEFQGGRQASGAFWGLLGQQDILVMLSTRGLDPKLTL